MNDGLIIEKTCSCPARMRFQKNKDCKHIKRAIQELKDFKIEITNELPKKETSNIQPTEQN